MKLAMLIDPSNPSAPRVIDLETHEPVVLAPGNYEVQVVVSPASTEKAVGDPVPLPLLWRARVNKLLLCLEQAATIIDSAAEVIEDIDDDIDGECAGARADAESFRQEVACTRETLDLIEHTKPHDFVDREVLGRVVRETWVTWASEQPDVAEHPSWLVPWEDLPERDREVDRRIGEACALKLLGLGVK